MQRLNEDIKTGKLQGIYLLCGEEAYLRRQYRDRLKNALVGDDTMNYHYFEGKNISVGEIIDLAETLPFFAERRLIVMENTHLFKSGGEQLADYLEERAESTYFLFVEPEIDKRSKLFKTVKAKGSVVEFVTQDEATLTRWILGMMKKEGKNISQNNLRYLLEKTGTDMENIRKETEKLFCYCLDKAVIEREDIDEICTKQISGHIFDMIGAIADKQQEKALALYYDLLALKEPPMRILFLIAKHFNQLLQVKDLHKKGFAERAIGERVGIPPFAIRKYVTQAGRFSMAELRGAVEACVRAEEDIKTGRMNDTLSVELLIVGYSR